MMPGLRRFWKMSSQVENAIAIARIMHAGQKRWSNEDYFTGHLEKVAFYVRDRWMELFPRRVWQEWLHPVAFNNVIAAAYLHDVLEDTPITSTGLHIEGVNPMVIAMVENLTKRQGESYFNFIMRIKNCECPGSIAIKLADLTCNMADADEKEKKSARYAKYELSRYILQGLE
jgi:(p)ppGpp synthase/HD superfamily hydrolase